MVSLPWEAGFPTALALKTLICQSLLYFPMAEANRTVVLPTGPTVFYLQTTKVLFFNQVISPSKTFILQNPEAMLKKMTLLISLIN